MTYMKSIGKGMTYVAIMATLLNPFKEAYAGDNIFKDNLTLQNAGLAAIVVGGAKYFIHNDKLHSEANYRNKEIGMQDKEIDINYFDFRLSGTYVEGLEVVLKEKCDDALLFEVKRRRNTVMVEVNKKGNVLGSYKGQDEYNSFQVEKPNDLREVISVMLNKTRDNFDLRKTGATIAILGAALLRENQ